MAPDRHVFEGEFTFAIADGIYRRGACQYAHAHTIQRLLGISVYNGTPYRLGEILGWEDLYKK
jgi:hypothetical protein